MVIFLEFIDDNVWQIQINCVNQFMFFENILYYFVR